MITNWEEIPEVEPDEIDLQMLADIEEDEECKIFVSQAEMLAERKKLFSKSYEVKTMLAHPKHRQRRKYAINKTVVNKKAIAASTADSKTITTIYHRVGGDDCEGTEKRPVRRRRLYGKIGAYPRHRLKQIKHRNY
ncbi:MAG: hypothetical protein FWG65_08060 [Turicibacter sp.]|nr:hypothetical protein [Turicibacter sp.]